MAVELFGGRQKAMWVTQLRDLVHMSGKERRVFSGFPSGSGVTSIVVEPGEHATTVTFDRLLYRSRLTLTNQGETFVRFLDGYKEDYRRARGVTASAISFVEGAIETLRTRRRPQEGLPARPHELQAALQTLRFGMQATRPRTAA